MTCSRRARLRALAPAILILVLLAAVPAQAKQTVRLAPVTTGAKYDRNPVLLREGGETLLVFARSQEDCDRLAGCNADNTDYDLYVKSGKKGDDFGPAQRIALNEGLESPSGFFRGRTPAATAAHDGTIHVFWASGGITAPLFHVVRNAKTKQWGPVEEIALPDGVGAFNVEAITKGKSVFVYTEEYAYATNAGGIAAYRLAGDQLVSRTDVAPNGQLLPKAVVDHKDRVRMVVTDGTTISGTTSLDGLHFGPLNEVITGEPFALWDPSIAEVSGNDYVLTYAPNQADGSQRIEGLFGRDFASWSTSVPFTDASSGTVTWWDYWPEVIDDGPASGVYFTSERPLGGNPSGTGHIWAFDGR